MKNNNESQRVDAMGNRIVLSSRVKNLWHKSGSDLSLKGWAKLTDDTHAKDWLKLKAAPVVRRQRVKIKKKRGGKD